MAILALAVVVAFKLLAGQINVHGLLLDKATGKFSPGRLQLLLVTVGAAAYYGFEILLASESGALPQVPGPVLFVVGASNAGYLGGKVYASLLAKLGRV